MQKENEQLKSELAMETRHMSAKQTSGALSMLTTLQDQGDMYTRKIEIERQRNIERNLGPLIRDHSIGQEGLWSYIDIYDLANAIVLSASADHETAPGHEVLYIAAEDNIGGARSQTSSGARRQTAVRAVGTPGGEETAKAAEARQPAQRTEARWSEVLHVHRMMRYHF